MGDANKLVHRERLPETGSPPEMNWRIRMSHFAWSCCFRTRYRRRMSDGWLEGCSRNLAICREFWPPAEKISVGVMASRSTQRLLHQAGGLDSHPPPAPYWTNGPHQIGTATTITFPERSRKSSAPSGGETPVGTPKRSRIIPGKGAPAIRQGYSEGSYRNPAQTPGNGISG